MTDLLPRLRCLDHPHHCCWLKRGLARLLPKQAGSRGAHVLVCFQSGCCCELSHSQRHSWQRRLAHRRCQCHCCRST
ncbi:hypothetical protein GQ54DRAFT_200490 [Martensiomyces pterosporus]|nr:hypothetical protein GQ54DRAFT_200490 [Martensiomyces pterosporus]